LREGLAKAYADFLEQYGARTIDQSRRVLVTVRRAAAAFFCWENPLASKDFYDREVTKTDPIGKKEPEH
jgi:hypothetical protein